MSDAPYTPRTFPVSVKGVVVRDGRVLLLRNERDEWELPGGKIELGETPEECLAREIEEETGWPVTVAQILDSWMYHITQVDKHVFIVTYGCHVDSDAPVVVSSEHKEAGLFTEDEVPRLTMPEGYKRSVLSWFAQPDV
nr:NUDIX domain-containing protein [Nocardiopsis sp. L17-MgMaSL7]